MKKNVWTIWYCMSEEVMRKAEIKPSQVGLIPLLVPQVNGTLILEGTTWNIAKVKHDLDKQEITVNSSDFMALIRGVRKERAEEELQATKEYPRNCYGTNTLTVNERLDKICHKPKELANLKEYYG